MTVDPAPHRNERNALTAAERDVLAALQEFCFNAPTCRPSQQTIADRLGRSREHINRTLNQLRHKGHVTWTKERRPGSRWTHNVYQIAHWSPPLRHRTVRNMTWIRQLQQQRRQRCQNARETGPITLKRTATPCRALAPRTPSSSVKQLKDQRCGRERASTNKNLVEASLNDRRDITDNLVILRPGQQHEIPCASCSRLEDLLKQSEINARDERQMWEDQLAEKERLQRSQGATIQALKRELAAAREEEPEADAIRDLLDAWKRLTGHPRAKTPLAGERAKFVRQALKHHEPDELLEALNGLALYPYATGKGRQASGTPKQRYDDVEYALKNEKVIDQMRGRAQRAWLLAQGGVAEARVIADETWATAMRWLDLCHYARFFPDAVGVVELQRRIDAYTAEWERDREQANASLVDGEVAA